LFEKVIELIMFDTEHF